MVSYWLHDGLAKDDVQWTCCLEILQTWHHDVPSACHSDDLTS